MSAKKYVFSLTAVMFVFLIANILFWHIIVKPIFDKGDLWRMGSISTAEPITEEIYYPIQRTELPDYIALGKHESIDVLTIGDSFTNGKDGNGNSYPDYLASEYGLNVVNAKIGDNCIRGLYTLMGSKYFENLRPKFIILENVERAVPSRLALGPITWDENADHESWLTRKRGHQNVSGGFIPAIMTKASVMFIGNKLRHMVDPERLSDEVYITKLSQNFFTNPGDENTLLFYMDDLMYLDNPFHVEILNQNLNNAARILKAKGIKMIFFSAADKYDLYYPYIIDKKGRPENPMYNDLRNIQDKEYIYLDTITILREALKRGEQDLYWLHDTHWSHRGIKVFCDELVKYILPELH